MSVSQRPLEPGGQRPLAQQGAWEVGSQVPVPVLHPERSEPNSPPRHSLGKHAWSTTHTFAASSALSCLPQLHEARDHANARQDAMARLRCLRVPAAASVVGIVIESTSNQGRQYLPLGGSWGGQKCRVAR